MTVWLDADQQRLWRSYLLVQARLGAELNRRLQAGAGLSLADYDVLVQLSEAPAGRRRPAELQRALAWEQSRLSHQLTRMRGRGLVERRDCAEDGRGVWIVLTAAGRRAVEAAAPAHVAAVRELFTDHLDPARAAALTGLTDAVRHALDAAAAKH